MTLGLAEYARGEQRLCDTRRINHRVTVHGTVQRAAYTRMAIPDHPHNVRHR
jgi:hypothetical protein